MAQFESYLDQDRVVVIDPSHHGEMAHTRFSLEELARRGIDIGYPFIVWVDETSRTVYARQLPEWRDGDPAELFVPEAPLVDREAAVIAALTTQEGMDTALRMIEKERAKAPVRLVGEGR